MKSQGKRLDQFLKDTVTIQETRDNLENWLIKVDSAYQAV